MEVFIEQLRDRDFVRYMMLRCINDYKQKRDITTLFEFDNEISRIPFIVNDPMMGYIRIAWWRENLFSNKFDLTYNENSILLKTQGFLYYNHNNHIVKDSVEDLLKSIELLIEKKKYPNIQLFIDDYIAPLGVANAHLICNALEIEFNSEIEKLFQAYAATAFVRSYDALAEYGWEIFEFPEQNLMHLLKYAESNFKKVTRVTLKNKIFKILFIAGDFYTSYYLRHIPLKDTKLYEPNLGLLRFKLALGVIF